MIFISGFYNTGVSNIAKLFYNSKDTCDYLGNCSYLNQLLTSYRHGKETWQSNTRYFFKTPNNFISFNKSLFDNYFLNLKKYTNDKILIHHDDNMVDKFIELNELYPNSKFILVVRDPRDSIALSIDSLKIDNISYLFELYMSLYESFIRYIKEKKLSNFIIIKYEDLIQDSNKVIEQIYNFTGIKISINNKFNDNNIGKYRYILKYNDIEMISSSRSKLKKIFDQDIFCDDIEFEYNIKNQKETIDIIKHLYENASLDQVIDISKSAIEKFPCYEFYKVLALTYTEMGDFENGHKYLTKALTYKKDADLFICEGMLYEINSEYDKSIKSFEKAISLVPNLSDAYNHLARILKK
jgi:tetratricopeptide (TPR) repeat protein